MSFSSGVPKFLTKIWALVEDHRNSNYICWSQDGNSFIVLDEGRFAKEILPKHFKHNNMASFVRQLNWYGFHKVMQDETGAARHDKYCSGRYQHQFFKRGQEELLTKIKRKVTPSTGDKRAFRKAKEDTVECGEETCTLICTGQTIEPHQCKTKVPVLQIEEGKTGPDDLQKILAFLHQLQARQDVLDTTVESLKRENEALWKEVLQLRPAQAPFEPVASSQSYDQMASLQTNQPLMIDSTGNYNQLSVSKTSQTVIQAFDNGWSTDMKSSRGIKRTVKEDIDSSAEEPNDHLLSVSFHRAQEYDKYQTDDSDPSDIHSCQSDEMANDEEYSSNHSNSFAKIAENPVANRRKQVPHKRLKSSAERCVSATKAQNGSQWIGGSEHEDEGKNCFVDSGCPKKTFKSCSASCYKMGHMLKKIHQDNTCLTEKVLAVEQQSFQKLSEISTMLSTLANYMMNTQNCQRSSCSHSLDAANIHEKERQSSHRHHQGLWSDTTSYSAKKEYDS